MQGAGNANANYVQKACNTCRYDVILELTSTGASVHSYYMGHNQSGLRFFACNDCARYDFNSMHCRSKCNDCSRVTCCNLELDTDIVEVTEIESDNAVRICCT
ncbi:hypothetical protein N9L68_02955 [bacterium]|nr:hypothetical protein [bacterium]